MSFENAMALCFVAAMACYLYVGRQLKEGVSVDQMLLTISAMWVAAMSLNFALSLALTNTTPSHVYTLNAEQAYMAGLWLAYIVTAYFVFLFVVSVLAWVAGMIKGQGQGFKMVRIL